MSEGLSQPQPVAGRAKRKRWHRIGSAKTKLEKKLKKID
jgi:hypothetical protein